MSAEPAMTLEEDLPQGWRWATLGEICVPATQVVPSDLFEEQFTYIDISSIDNQSHCLTGVKQLVVTEAPSRARQLVRSGDTLFSTVRTYLKNIAYVDERFDGQIASTGFCVLRPTDGIEGHYLFYYVLTINFIDKISALQRGVSYPAVRDGDVRAQPIPVAPTNEQRRIVEKIDALFSQIEAGEQALARAQKFLQRYRQSVLNAAVTGELTCDRREQHKGEVESGEVLLKRILQARREVWEQAELAKMHARGKPPKDDRWKQKYKEPEPPDTTDLPDLPEGWAWTTLEQLCDGARPIAYGVLQPGADVADGIPFVRVSDVANGNVDEINLKRISPTLATEYDRTILRGGEVLLTVVGSIGRTAVVPPTLAGANIARAVAMLPVADAVVPRWPELWLRLESTRQRLENLAHEVARKTLNLEDIRTFVLPLPPYEEQQLLCEEAEVQWSRADHLLIEISGCKALLDALRQSVLSAAFLGKLVPQDPADQPASVLLERIREERAAPLKDAGRRLTGRRGRASNKGGLAMVKTRKEIKPTHLQDIIRASNGRMVPEALWKASDLAIDEFYKQLREEVAAGHIREERDGSASRIVCG